MDSAYFCAADSGACDYSRYDGRRGRGTVAQATLAKNPPPARGSLPSYPFNEISALSFRLCIPTLKFPGYPISSGRASGNSIRIDRKLKSTDVIDVLSVLLILRLPPRRTHQLLDVVTCSPLLDRPAGGFPGGTTKIAKVEIHHLHAAISQFAIAIVWAARCTAPQGLPARGSSSCKFKRVETCRHKHCTKNVCAMTSANLSCQEPLPAFPTCM